MPSAGEIVNAWPDQVIDRIDERTVVVTLSHEERLDIPAVAAALERNARYIGARRREAHGRAPPREAHRARLLRERLRAHPRPGRPRPRRPLAGAGRARDRGRDRGRDLGRPQGRQGRPAAASVSLRRASRSSRHGSWRVARERAGTRAPARVGVLPVVGAREGRALRATPRGRGSSATSSAAAARRRARAPVRRRRVPVVGLRTGAREGRLPRARLRLRTATGVSPAGSGEVDIDV